MASAMNLTEIWKLTVACTQNGQVALNTVHLQVTNVTGTSATDAEFAAEFDTNLVTPYKAIINNNATYFGVKVSRVWPKATAIPVVHASFTGVGTGGATALPTAVCGLIQWRTAFFGKTARGRIFTPFPPSAALTATGEPTMAYQTLIAALGTEYAGTTVVGTGANTASLALVIYNPKNLGVCFPILAGTAEPSWGTQHRRGDFGRLNNTTNPLPV